jgi:hypothetical protein
MVTISGGIAAIKCWKDGKHNASAAPRHDAGACVSRDERTGIVASSSVPCRPIKAVGMATVLVK